MPACLRPREPKFFIFLKNFFLKGGEKKGQVKKGGGRMASRAGASIPGLVVVVGGKFGAGPNKQYYKKAQLDREGKRRVPVAMARARCCWFFTARTGLGLGLVFCCC